MTYINRVGLALMFVLIIQALVHIATGVIYTPAMEFWMMLASLISAMFLMWPSKTERRSDAMITALIAYAFDRHCMICHNADYEVCRDPLCRFAYLVERIFRRHWYEE